MRTAAVALVLIAGATVVLVFGNMLNSWVLGGLMGGLAALLLSIPISLALFSFLSRHQDQRLGTMEPELEEISLARSYDYEDVEEIQPVHEAEVDEYELPRHRGMYEYQRRNPVTRELPAPIYPRLPAAGQSQASALVDSTLLQHGSKRSFTPRQLPRVSPAMRGQEASSQRLSADRRPYYSGSPRYQGNVTRSLHQSAALRTARQEAAQRQEAVEDVGILPSTKYYQKRIPTTRPLSSANSSRQADPQMNRRTSRQLPRQRVYQSQDRIRRPNGGLGTEPVNRNLGYPQTGPLHQVTRKPQWDEEYFDPEVSTGSLKNPLVRRAPYMYEDDALRQELAQQVDRPIVRRSSRYEQEE